MLTGRGVECSITDEVEPDDHDRDARRRQRHRVDMTTGRLGGCFHRPSLVDHPGNHHRGEDEAASEGQRQEDETRASQHEARPIQRSTMRHDQDEQERLQARRRDIGEGLGPGERLGLTKIEENDRQEGVAIAPSTADLANRPEQPEGECREQQDVQVENRLRVEAEEGVARDENQLQDRHPVSLDVLPEPGEINSLGAGHEGDEEPVLPARSTISVKRHESECHHGEDEPRSEYEPAGLGLISSNLRQHY